MSRVDPATVAERLAESAEAKRRLADSEAGAIARAAELIADAVVGGKKVLAFGNGGSAADAQHVAAELVGRFQAERRALPAIGLVSDAPTLTSIANDYGFEEVFARQLDAVAATHDVALAISTSGRSPNVLAGVRRARELGLVTIALTGGDGGELARLADVAIVVPSWSTARIQECHVAVVHILCEAAEAATVAAAAGRSEPVRTRRVSA